MLDWLSPINFRSIYKANIEKWMPGTWEAFVNQTFGQWWRSLDAQATDNFCISGMRKCLLLTRIYIAQYVTIPAGAGKTILA
jgi:hypothetical protein